MHLSFCQLSTSDRSVRLPFRTFPSRSDRNPLASVGHPIFVECFGLLLALVGRNKEDGIRERRQTGAITPPDIPEIGVKPNKLKCAHSSFSSFTRPATTATGFLFSTLTMRMPPSQEKKVHNAPPPTNRAITRQNQNFPLAAEIERGHKSDS